MSDTRTFQERGQAKTSPLNVDSLLRSSLDPRTMWLTGVECETAQFRDESAREHFRRGREVEAKRLEAGKPAAAKAGLMWHRQRGKAELNRFQRTYECGEETFWIVCTECNRCEPKTKTCRSGLLCLRCRKAIAGEKQALFTRARDRALSRMRAKGLDKPMRKGGAFSEKLLTLTVPHDVSFGVGARVRVAFQAWALFLKSLNRYLRDIGVNKECHFFRAFEWTPGNDDLGHPHFHVWILSPFVEQPLIRHWWECALRTAGMQVHVAIVHIERCHGVDGVAKELIKYLTKDILPNQQQVSVETFAELYKAVHGHRITQSSAGFFKGIDRRAECPCGAIGCFKRVSEPPPQSGEQSVVQPPVVE